MEIEICMINLSKGTLDNDYTIFESGKIKHFYDRNAFRLNIEEWLTVNDLTEDVKKVLMDKCPSDKKEKVKAILYP